MSLRIVFAGTPLFALTVLQTLDQHYRPIALYTQPDRQRGRGRSLSPSPVKQYGMQHAIPVYQPDHFKSEESLQAFQALQADVLVVAAYGLLLPIDILNSPRFGCINVHASLLPAWRGASPIQQAILHGDSLTGITIMQMDRGLDTGDILLQKELPIALTDSTADLMARMSVLGGETLIEALNALEAGHLSRQAQDDKLASHAPKISKADALLDWTKPADILSRQIRAYNPWPVAHVPFNDGYLRIWHAEVLDQHGDAPPGTIVALDSGIVVQTGQGCLRLLSVQLSNHRRMEARDFLNSQASLKIGRVLQACTS